MKKRLCLALLALLLVLSLCTPAMAAVEYGVIYDETETLDSPSLTTLGEESMLDGNFVGRRFAVSFSLRRAAA